MRAISARSAPYLWRSIAAAPFPVMGNYAIEGTYRRCPPTFATKKTEGPMLTQYAHLCRPGSEGPPSAGVLFNGLFLLIPSASRVWGDRRHLP